MQLVDINNIEPINKLYEGIPEYIVKERYLSLSARGLLNILKNLPDNFDLSINNLLHLCKENKQTVQYMMSVLKNHGYVENIIIPKKESKSGKVEYKWIINKEKINV